MSYIDDRRMSYIDGWATYCVKQRIPFADFERGVRIMMDDIELWARRGFAELYAQVLQRCSTTQERRR